MRSLLVRLWVTGNDVTLVTKDLVRFLMRKILMVVLGSLLLAGCQTGPITQAQINARPNVWTDTPALAEARRCQKEFGYTYGTPEYGNCLRQLEADRMNRAMATMPYTMQLLQAGQPRVVGSQSGGYSNSGVQSNGAIVTQGAGYLTGQRMSGQWRYCDYQKLAQVTTVRIPSTQLCPQIN